MRVEFTKAVKRDAFARANGKCEECGQKLFVGNCEYHHGKEAFMGGEATLENCVVLCRGCHRLRTISRRPTIDKTRRQSDKNMGIRRKSTMPGSRSSKWKMTMRDGPVLR